MRTTDLQLDDPGSLPRPGPIGRLVRLAFGALCLWYVKGLVQVTGDLVENDGHIRSIVWSGIIPGLFLVSYVINIGYSRAWKKWPGIISVVALAAATAVGYLNAGTIESALLAQSLWTWELYVFIHLGVAFVVAAALGTPGCELRAFHDLYSRISGIPTREHHCPVGPLHAIDQWEAVNRQG